MEKFKLTPIEKSGQRVLTTAQLAEAYRTDVKVISKNFNRNKERYIEGIHFYRLTGEELKKFKTIRQFDESSIRVNVIYLWTERGALLHAKSLNTDKAWEVYEFLVDNYFHTREMIASYNDALIIEKLELLERRMDSLEKQMDSHEKSSVSRADNIIKTLFDISNEVFVASFKVIYDKLFR